MSSEVDWECAKALGWIHSPRFLGDTNGYWIMPDGTHYIDGDRPTFSTDHDAARMLEDEIERRHITHLYLAALIELVRGSTLYEDAERSTGVLWALLRATPEQKARAFLEAVKE